MVYESGGATIPKGLIAWSKAFPSFEGSGELGWPLPEPCPTWGGSGKLSQTRGYMKWLNDCVYNADLFTAKYRIIFLNAVISLKKNLW